MSAANSKPSRKKVRYGLGEGPEYVELLALMQYLLIVA
jgi:hypothetical protein